MKNKTLIIFVFILLIYSCGDDNTSTDSPPEDVARINRSEPMPISYSLADKVQVNLSIRSNNLFQEIKTLVDVIQVAGSYRVLWDFTDNSGNPVPSGYYNKVLAVPSNTFIKKFYLE